MTKRYIAFDWLLNVRLRQLVEGPCVVDLLLGWSGENHCAAKKNKQDHFAQVNEDAPDAYAAGVQIPRVRCAFAKQRRPAQGSKPT